MEIVKKIIEFLDISEFWNFMEFYVFRKLLKEKTLKNFWTSITFYRIHKFFVLFK